MRTIYVDADFKCHIVDDGTMTAVETSFFDGKCDAFVEGYRFVPFGKSWTRPDGSVFHGEMITPVKDFDILETVQRLHTESSIIQADVDTMLVDYEYRLTMLELGI